MTTTYLFFLSMIAMGLMIAWKIFELKVKRVHLIANLFVKGDEKIHLWAGKASSAYKRYEKIVNIFVFEFLPSYFYEKLVQLKDYVAKEYYKAGDEFRGRRVLRQTGSVSFFLERLSENKQGISNRKI